MVVTNPQKLYFPAAGHTKLDLVRGSRRSSSCEGSAEGDALKGLECWKGRHPEAAAKLIPDDVLVDAMRGRSTAWYRIRVNMRHVPEGERPAAEPPDADGVP